MFNKLKQFKDMRDQAKVIQEKLSKETCEGSSGFGKVKIVIDGTQKIISVTIDESVMGSDNKTRLESLIKDATNDAIHKCHRIMAEKMKGHMGDFKMPEME